jgi:3'-phosphoadenosine 5'-phosphosulfate sulfotransferase (PAPS reductase)/FAD synthetase
MTHTIEELQMRQALPLNLKVAMTKTRIREWVNEYGESGVYVSFSGGKDSTVLLDIVRQNYPNIPAVFVDTGLEYPEIREFVKTFDNVVWLKPKMTFKEVIEKYGYPFISKEVSECVYGARKYLTSILQEASLDRQTDRQTDSTDTSTINYVELASILNQRMANKSGGNNQRLAIMLGMLTKDQEIKANIPSEDKSAYSQERYKFLLDCPWSISNRCCNVMKKEPSHRYNKETGRKPMTAQMASESRLRTQKWLQNGCNGFNLKQPISNPMSFWTEQDVLLYIKQNNLPICSVYGEIVEDRQGTDEVEGQMTISDMQGFEDMELFDAKRLPLKTTGCNRTGCMFCGFGCHLEKEGEGRFERMKETHPKVYDYVMRPDGLNYKAIIDWINEHGNLNIRY